MKRGSTVALLERQAQVPLRADGGLRLVVVADTHSAPHPATHKLVAAERPDAILHAGDIGKLEVLDGLAAIAPLFAIRGNIDARRPDLADVITLDVRSGPDTVLRLLLLHIGVNGPRIRADAARLAQARGARVLVCGHSHVPFIGQDRGLTVFNPGSVGPRRFQLPIVFGVLEIVDHALRMRHVDCETGQAWTPGGV